MFGIDWNGIWFGFCCIAIAGIMATCSVYKAKYEQPQIHIVKEQ